MNKDAITKPLDSPYTEPFLFEGSRTGCLLIHGFTGAPGRVRLLGEYLHAQGGYTVSGIRLKGHGTSLQDMANTNWKDWLESAREGYQELSRRCDQVNVIGFSMGGLLSLLMAEEFPVHRIITINAALKPKDPAAYLAPILRFFMKYNLWDDEASDRGEGLEAYDTAYPGMPVKAIGSMLKLGRLAGKDLNKITQPALIFQSQKDKSVNPASAGIIYRKIASDKKEVVELPQSSHVAPLGPERETLHEKALAFLQAGE